MIVVTRVEKTCNLCPSQWEGVTDDGRVVYARYRHGWFSCGVGQTLDEAVDDESTLSIEYGDRRGCDGYMTYAQLRTLTAGIIRWPRSETNGETT